MLFNALSRWALSLLMLSRDALSLGALSLDAF